MFTFSPRFFMTDEKPQRPSDGIQNRLRPEDQARVDAFIKRGVNAVERKPFRPLRLFFILVGVVLGLSIISQLLARWAGIY